MFSLTLETTTLGILAACEMIARSLWPELFDGQEASEAETAVDDDDPCDEMAIW